MIHVEIIIVDVHATSGVCGLCSLSISSPLVVRDLAVHAAQRQQTDQSTSTMLFFTHVSQMISASLRWALRCAPQGTYSSAPASHLTSSRFCGVTFCARLFLRLGVLFRFFCWQDSVLVGLLFTCCWVCFSPCCWDCSLFSPLLAMFLMCFSLDCSLHVLHIDVEAHHLLTVCIAFEAFFAGAVAPLWPQIALFGARRQRHIRGHCSRRGHTRASAYGCSAGHHALGGVCSIDLQCSGVILSKCAQLRHGQECHELTFGHKGHQCALVSLDLK